MPPKKGRLEKNQVGQAGAHLNAQANGFHLPGSGNFMIRRAKGVARHEQQLRQ